MKYPHLFSPIKFNGLTIKNRIEAPPCGGEFKSKAFGGAGIVVCGHSVVEPGRSSFVSGEEKSGFFKYELEKTQEKIRICHTAGARASIEIFHAGQYARVNPGDYAVGPCDLVREDGTTVKALTPEMMDNIADLYAESAWKAKDLGFDAIFMHFAHGWLAAEFISPLFNHRTDEYGGSLENRAKFPLMILERVRNAVGKDYPIEMRISGEECVPGSIEFSDTLAFILKAEPYIDAVQISAGLDINYEGNVRMATTGFIEHMPNVKWAEVVKQQVKKIKVGVVGAVMSPDEAEMLISSGKVDYVACGRSFIADPDWPKKAYNGLTDEIVPCIRCLQCYHISTARKNVGCTVNPYFHNENFLPNEPKAASIKKRVVIIGAGPGGIMAGLTAKKRGHEVIVLEKQQEIGGMLSHISKEYYKEDIAIYYEYLKKQVIKNDLNIRYGITATKEYCASLKPDVLIIACGAEPIILDIPGTDNKNVMGFLQAINQPQDIKDKVVIIGGGTIGMEIGLELAEQEGKDVSIVEMTDELAAQGNMLYRIALRHKYEVLDNMKFYMNSICTQIKEDEVIIKNNAGEEQVIKADTVILAVGVKTNREFVDSFYDLDADIYEIGDAVRPRKLFEAISEGYGVASFI